MADGQGSVADSIQGGGFSPTANEDSGEEVILEGYVWKLSRNRQWQQRYAVFYANQVLCYYHKKGEKARTRASFLVSRDSGCEISDLYVEQRQFGHEKENLYCINLTWPDDMDTVVSGTAHNYHNSMRDELVLRQAPSSAPPSATSSPVRKSPKAMNRFKSPFKYHHNTRSFDGSDPSKKRFAPPSLRDIKRRLRSAGSYSEGLNYEGEENSIVSLETPQGQRKLKHSNSWMFPKKRNDELLERSLPNLELESLGSKKPKRKRSFLKRMNNSVPAFVDFDLPQHTIIEVDNEHASPVNRRDLAEVTDDKLMQPGWNNAIPTEEKSKELEIEKESDRTPISNKVDVISAMIEGPVKVEPTTVTNSDDANSEAKYTTQHAAEQEKLLGQYIEKKRVQQKQSRKKMVEGGKVVVAGSAAIGLGVLTAGVGLAAGLVFLGAAAAVGGTAGVAEAWS